MSEPKHTPGEWRVGFENAGIMAQCIERNPGWIPVTGACMSFAFGAVVAMVDGEANARLIAAAPDLLEAAIEMRDALPSSDPGAFRAPYLKMLAAIAKAEGK